MKLIATVVGVALIGLGWTSHHAVLPMALGGLLLVGVLYGLATD